MDHARAERRTEMRRERRVDGLIERGDGFEHGLFRRLFEGDRF